MIKVSRMTGPPKLLSSQSAQLHFPHFHNRSLPLFPYLSIIIQLVLAVDVSRPQHSVLRDGVAAGAVEQQQRQEGRGDEREDR